MLGGDFVLLQRAVILTLLHPLYFGELEDELADNIGIGDENALSRSRRADCLSLARLFKMNGFCCG